MAAGRVVVVRSGAGRPGGFGEIGLRPAQRDDRDGGRAIGVEEKPPAAGVERHGHVVVPLGRRNQEPRVAAPAAAVGRHRQVDLDRRGLVEVVGDGALRLSGELGEAPAGTSPVIAQVALEVDLPLADPARLESAEHGGAELRVVEREGEPAGQPLIARLLW